MIAMPPTAITVAELPVEPDALQAFALEQNRLACVLWEQLEALQHQIAQANRARFGVSSERLAGQAELLDATTALPVPPEPAAVPVAGHTRKGRPALPKDLPRTRIEYDLNDEQKAAFESLERIGEERSETLHYEPSVRDTAELAFDVAKQPSQYCTLTFEYTTQASELLRMRIAPRAATQSLALTFVRLFQ